MKKSKLDWSNVELQNQIQELLSNLSLNSLSKTKLMKYYQKVLSLQKGITIVIYMQRRIPHTPRPLPMNPRPRKNGYEPSAGCLGNSRARGY